MTTTTPSVLKDTENPKMIAFIDASLCIGCTKCLRICPEGAIEGARRVKHKVKEDACNGCQLCAPVCPVDCISYREAAPVETPALALDVEVEARAPSPGLVLPGLSAELEAKIAAAREKSHLKYSQKGPTVPKLFRDKDKEDDLR